MDTKFEEFYAPVILEHVEKDIIIRVEGVYISVLEPCRKRKFRTFLHLTLISKFFIMSRFSDFVVCSTNLYIWSSGVYFSGLEHHLELKFSM